MKLHVGCGRDIREGYVNLDVFDLPGVDLVYDLEKCKDVPLPFENDTFDEIYCSHVIEHIHNTLPMMEELHRVSKPNAKAIFKVPYGSSDDAFEDPTHVRQYFLNSFQYFSQPFYWRADYGYRGDWLVEDILLYVHPERLKSKSTDEIMAEVKHFRNIVVEMAVFMRAVKPIRDPRVELQVRPNIHLVPIELR